mmetsp:Transcript_22241/g.56551  ORF Transcript_22241/g.56551 Transcript_22241/m.56551 type:complete len:237 (-) Transcript_22241:337-1047(-)
MQHPRCCRSHSSVGAGRHSTATHPHAAPSSRSPRRSQRGRGGGCVAHAGINLALTLAGLVVVPELYLKLGACMGQHVQEHADGVPAADGVAVLRLVLRECGRLARLNGSHALVVQPPDGLPDRALALVVPLVREAAAPVAKVGRQDEQVGGVIQVGRQQLPVPRLAVARQRPNHDGHQREGAARQRAHDVRRVQLKAVLRLVRVHVHLLERARRAQLRVHALVDRHRAQGGVVRIS